LVVSGLSQIIIYERGVMNSMSCAINDGPQKEDSRQEIYEAPAIILESCVTVRAGTPPEPNTSDPADIFGD
jgi:hypothetical protein